jgi:hypothetical protein
VDKLYAVGSLPMVLNLYLGTKSLIAEQFPLLSRNSYKLFVRTPRLDLLYPLVGLAAITAFLAFRGRKNMRTAAHRNSATTYTLVLTAACVLVCILIALTIGRVQPVSYYRYSTFAVPVIILFGVALWHSVIPFPNTGISTPAGPHCQLWGFVFLFLSPTPGSTATLMSSQTRSGL